MFALREIKEKKTMKGMKKWLAAGLVWMLAGAALAGSNATQAPEASQAPECVPVGAGAAGGEVWLDYSARSVGVKRVAVGSRAVAASHVATHSPYTIVFHANGGKGTMAAQRIRWNVATKLSPNKFTKNGFIFIGWSLSQRGKVMFANQAVVKNLAPGGTKKTLFAKWGKRDYAVSFDPNGGRGKMANQAMVYGKTAKLRGNTFTKKGYVFTGWSETKNGKVVYKDRQEVRNLKADGTTKKLYAQWAKENCTVKFDANGGSSVSFTKRKFRYNARIGSLPKATRKGYTLSGWYTSRSAGKKIGTTTRVTGDSTVYAHWSPVTYNVRYDYDGGTRGVHNPSTGKYGKVFYVGAPRKDGCQFAGWSVSRGLNTSTARYGRNSTPGATITSASKKCANGIAGDVYFRNLRATAGNVTLKANWTAAANTWNVFQAGGSAAWFAQTATTHDGVDAHQSGRIADGQSSSMQHTASGPGTISFWWKVSSESGYDVLEFLVDGVQQAVISGTDGNWAQVSLRISGNDTHVFKWTYRKDGSVSDGSDCGWVDQVCWFTSATRAAGKSSGDAEGSGGAASRKAVAAAHAFAVDDCGVFETGGCELEISPEPPAVEELGGREWAGELESPISVDFLVPDGGTAWQLWSAERGVLSDEAAEAGTVTLQLPDQGVWYWMRFLDADGLTLSSTWLFPLQ
jgi:uncharacterized repeat protein (TIGR02543 family)